MLADSRSELEGEEEEREMVMEEKFRFSNRAMIKSIRLQYVCLILVNYLST